jgi:uncharacterized protein (TIGR00251 family)
MIELSPHPRGTILPVRAHAGSRKNGILGEHNGMLRVAVTAAPEKGKANKAIIEVLADELKMAKSSIELVAGETSQQKRFLFVGVDRDKLQKQIERLLAC